MLITLAAIAIGFLLLVGVCAALIMSSGSGSGSWTPPARAPAAVA